ncbi:jg24554 [Pararge aegeria aegeria]|uniref:Jg24554 protein n=1 Tax=Pararge aegeria aegeria TaxID=348720 RepID=A0A8S4R0T1_9NEOP|nr:jg24554 [Pararge aegeria aegeria]
MHPFTVRRRLGLGVVFREVFFLTVRPVKARLSFPLVTTRCHGVPQQAGGDEVFSPYPSISAAKPYTPPYP